MRLSRGRRRGVSELVATMLTVAITIVAGAGLFGYVNGQAGTASQAYGQAVGTNVDYLNEKFTIVDMNWASSTSVTIWIYNTGKVPVSLLQVRLYDSTHYINLLYNYTEGSGTQTNMVYDLLSSASGRCGEAATAYESPPIAGSGGFSAALSYTATIQLTIPPASTGCPSYGQPLASGTTYYVVVAGLYGNSYTYSQVK